MVVYITAPPEHVGLLGHLRAQLVAHGHVVPWDWSEYAGIPDTCISVMTEMALRRGQTVGAADCLIIVAGATASTDHLVELGLALGQGKVIIALFVDSATPGTPSAFLSVPEVMVARSVNDAVALADATQFKRHRITTRIWAQ